MRVMNNEPFTNYLLACNQPIVKEELQQRSPGFEERLAATLVETMSHLGSEVCLPLVNKKSLIGFVNLGHKPGLGLYSHDELSLLRSLADNAAIALANAVLHEEWKHTQLLLRRADRLRSLEAIAGGFAHEVRNPLTSISTFIQLVPSRRDDPYSMDSFSAQVVDDFARIERLIEEILDYARYMKPKFSAESLNNIVSSCLQFIEVKADKLGITIEKHLAEDLPAMLVDRQQIKQVIMNLAMNAIDAMAKTGGHLAVTTRRVVRLDKSGWVQIEVADTGSVELRLKISRISLTRSLPRNMKAPIVWGRGSGCRSSIKSFKNTAAQSKPEVPLVRGPTFSSRFLREGLKSPRQHRRRRSLRAGSLRLAGSPFFPEASVND